MSVMAPSEQQRSPRGIHVLHIDDEVSQLEFAKLYLERADKTLLIESVGSPKDALRLLESRNYDCIVSDFQMPKMNGIEFAEKINENDDIPFIIYTGKGSEEIAEAAFAVGVDDYIRKEINPGHYQVLARRIRAAVEKKRAEEKVIQERDWAQRYLDVAAVMIVVLDTEGRVSLLNGRGCEILGVSQEEALGKNWFDTFLPSQNVEDVKQVFRELMEGNIEPVRFYENPVVSSSGEEQIIAWENSLLHDVDGTIIGTISSGSDITEQKEMEEALRHEESEKQAILNAIPDTLSLKDTEYRFVWVNKALVDSTGLTFDDLIGKVCYEVVNHREKPCEGCVFHEAMTTGERAHGEQVFPDGSNRDCIVVPIRDDLGKVVSAIDLSRDISKYAGYRERLEALHSHSTRLHEAGSVFEIAEHTLRSIEQVFGFGYSSFGVVEGDILREIFTLGLDVDEVFELQLDGPGITVRAIRTGEPQLVRDTRLDRDYVAGPAEGVMDPLSELVIPIKVGNTFEAMLNVESKKLDAFTDADVNLLEIFAGHVSSALTRLRQTERMKESEEQYRALLDSSRDAVLVITDGEYAYVNDRLVELLGYDSKQELMALSPLETISAEDRVRASKILKGRPIGEEHPLQYEVNVVRKDGSTIYLENNVSLIDFEGQVSSLVFARDITERKRMDEEKRQYQRRLEALQIISARLASVDTRDDVSRVVLEILRDLIGFSWGGVGIVDGKSIRYIQSIGFDMPEGFEIPLDGPGVMTRAVRTKESQLVPDVRTNSDYFTSEYSEGSVPRYLSALTVPVILNDEVVAVINMEHPDLGAFSDDDQRLLEIFAEHVSSAFNRIRHQRELEEVRERHSIELIEGIQRVSSMVRHDLRGPLQTIMNAAYFMKEDPGVVDEMRELVMSSVNHASEIMEDWRKQGISEKFVMSGKDLRALVDEALSTSLIPDCIKVSQDVESRVLDIDRVKVHRVLGNLIRNAVEAMPDGGVLSIRGSVEGDVYVLKVKDTGIGISTVDIPRLFTPFFSTKLEGVGLGLAFCKRAVEAHGGSISFESREEEGTTFTVRLPINTVSS